LGARNLDDHPWCYYGVGAAAWCLLVMLVPLGMGMVGGGTFKPQFCQLLSPPQRPLLATRPPSYHPPTLFAAASRMTQITLFCPYLYRLEKT